MGTDFRLSQYLIAAGSDKDGGMGTGMTVAVAQEATRPITEDALAGVSLLLGAS